MKKMALAALFVLVLLMTFTFTGCAEELAVEAGAEANPILEEYISELNCYETPEGIFEFENSYIMMDKHFVARVLYPVTGNVEIDREIETFVQEIVREHNNYAMERSSYDGEPAELTMEYEAQIVDGKYAGIKLSGIYNASFMAHPYDIIKTFNGSITEEKVLKITDIIAEDKVQKLCEMTATAAGLDMEDDINKEYPPEELLEGWRITDDGIEITLVRGKFTPMSSGSPVIQFTFDELKDMMVMNFGSEQEVKDYENEEQIPIIVPTVRELDPDKPMVAITFDDGPGAYTERLLDILDENDARGTFFLVGNQVKKRSETVQRMVAEGHEVAAHSWNHRQLTNLEGEELEEQFMKPRAAIYKATGVDTMIMRPPYGSYNDEVAEVAEKLGISAINWNVDTLDWKNKNADAVYKACMNGLKDGNIILCHDIHKTTVDAMEKVIPAIIEEGYQLVTVTELLTAEDGEIKAGELYFRGK